MKDKGINEKKVLSSQKKNLIKREEKILNKRENEYIKNKISPIKEKVEEKIPTKMIKAFEKAFEKGFYYVFEKGTKIIEKSYDIEKIKNEADINEYILSKKINNKNLKNFDKNAKASIWRNKGITTVEGIALGVFGIGLPDIPVFIGVILKTVYEICLSYGFDYNSKEEKVFILNIICASATIGEERASYSIKADNIGYNIDNEINSTVDISNMIALTSKILSKNLILAKFIQGMPIVGVYGGVANYKLIRDISEIASLKYKKRLLSKL